MGRPDRHDCIPAPVGRIPLFTRPTFTLKMPKPNGYAWLRSPVFVSNGTRAGVYIFADDHCPPHIRARHRGEGWIGRAKFTYLTAIVDLMSLAPLKNVPQQRVVNRLLDDVRSYLADCRRTWWETCGRTCLANQWASTREIGRVKLLAKPEAEARQVDAASYDPMTERVRILFRDGTMTEVKCTAMTTHRITNPDYAATLRSGQAEAETENRARSVRNVADRDVVEIVTTRNAGFLIPRRWISALQDVPVQELAKLEVWPDGSAIEIEERDIHISVHGLMVATLPAMLPAGTVAAIFAGRGGRAVSEAKWNSARANGRKGGRPRKAADPEAA